MSNEQIIEQEDLLIGRIASNECDATEWQQFEALATDHPQSWEHLARTLRDELQLRASLESSLGEADNVEIPAEAFAPPVIEIRRWSGWAVAAAIALIWVGIGVMQPNRPAGGIEQMGPGGGARNVVHASNPDDVLSQYVSLGRQNGRVLEELPMRMLDVRDVGDNSGAVEVLYVRQFLERARVNGAFTFQPDDLGRRILVPSELASFRTTGE